MKNKNVDNMFELINVMTGQNEWIDKETISGVCAELFVTRQLRMANNEMIVSIWDYHHE